VLAIGVGCLMGCGHDEANPDDSMASTLAEGKKAQGVTTNDVKPKDTPHQKAAPQAPGDAQDPSGAKPGTGATATGGQTGK